MTEYKAIEEQVARHRVGKTYLKACTTKTLRDLQLSHMGLISMMARIRGNMRD